MASFFGSILILLLFGILMILFFGLSLLARLVGGVKNLWNIFTGKGLNQGNRGYSRSNSGTYTSGNNNSGQQSGTSTDQGHRPHSKGVFADDEGTYVDFEEIKNPI